jgi:hypothetical protein
VLAIVSVTGGVAELDTDGDSLADDSGTLAALGITGAERAMLGGLYNAGQTLWRLPLSRLGSGAVSPGPGPLASVVPPPRTLVPTTPGLDHVLDLDVPVAGTQFSLHYASDRVLGTTCD